MEKINEENFVEIDFDTNLLLLFKKIIVKTIKKLFLYRSKDAMESFDFILNFNNYSKFFSNSKKNLIIYSLIVYIFCLISFHDSKTEINQSILNNFLNDILKIMCDGNVVLSLKNEENEEIINVNNNENVENEIDEEGKKFEVSHEIGICGMLFKFLINYFGFFIFCFFYNLLVG